MKSNTTPLNERNQVILFILIAFGITWLGWIPALIGASNQGFLLPTTNNFAKLGEIGSLTPRQQLLTTLFNFAVYGPLIAALALTIWETGREGLVELLRRIVKWRVGIRWYGIVIGMVIVISLIPWLIAWLSGQMRLDGTGVVWTLPLLAVLFIRQVLTSGLGEEPGWRGYLLPRLQLLYGSGKAIWVLGIIWAVWHYPFTIFDTLSNMGGDVPVMTMVITLVLSLAGQTMSLIGITYLYVWVYNNTQSVWLAILFHALSNAVPLVLLADISPSFSIIMALMPWLLVFILEKIYGKDDFPGAVICCPDAGTRFPHS